MSTASRLSTAIASSIPTSLIARTPNTRAAGTTIHNTARVYTPEDKAIQTPNSDTPYSFVGADLRAEPLVLTVPEVEAGRYYSLQFIDMYTFNFAYVGSRATGNGAGRFLLAGPGWQGETPEGVKEVIRSETELAFVLYRTQLFGPDDIDNVKAIQAGYKVEPLSMFLGQPAPAAAPAIDFMTPLTPDEQKTSPEFFDMLGFVLQFCPAVPVETELRARFAKLGIEGGETFDPAALAPETRAAVEAGMADAWAAFTQFKETELDTGKKSSADGFGTRAFLNGRLSRSHGFRRAWHLREFEGRGALSRLFRRRGQQADGRIEPLRASLRSQTDCRRSTPSGR